MGMDGIEGKLEKARERVRQALRGIRTGRASPAFVEDLPVEAYGATMALKTVASVSVPEPRTLVVTPWDPKTIPEVEKALEQADLGAAPSVHGDTIHVTLPPMTQERRAQLLRIVGKTVEEGRIAIRQIRDETIEELRRQQREKEISEDAFFRGKEEVERAVKDGNDGLEALRKEKEEELEDA